jgi:glutathione S-transferase
MPTLYYCETLNPQKACTVAKLVNAELDYVRVALEKGEHKQPAHLLRHPQGRVPVLVHGDEHVWESAAIMVWLSERANSDLWPADDTQPEVMKWLMFDAFTFLPLAGAFYFEHYIKPVLGIGTPDESVLVQKTPAFHEAARILDARLAQATFLAGERLSIADVALSATLLHAERIRLPLEPHANIRRWHEKLMEIEAFRSPFPD